MNRPFGYHITGGQQVSSSLRASINAGFTAAQIFLTPPQTFKYTPIPDGEIQMFKHLKETHGTKVYVHAPYVLHAFAKPENAVKNNQLIRVLLRVSTTLGVDGFVLHMGGTKWYDDPLMPSWTDKIYLEVATNLLSLFKGESALRCPILFENCANGNSMSGDLSVITSLLTQLRGRGFNVGLCMDTLHAWAWGYDYRTPEGMNGVTSAQIKEHLQLIHLNSGPEKVPCGSKYDRHASIEKGIIPKECLASILKAHPGIPVIAERDEYNDVLFDWEFVKLADEIKETSV